MLKHARLTSKDKVDIIDKYINHLTPMISLAEEYGKSRQGIWKILKKAGVDTSKHKLNISCVACGKEVFRTKARIRRQVNHFCSNECYHAFLSASPYTENRHSSRLARAKVAKYFKLALKNIVHHIDNNQFNNLLPNLAVFANQGDHIRCHRTGESNPIWEGKHENSSL